MLNKIKSLSITKNLKVLLFITLLTFVSVITSTAQISHPDGTIVVLDANGPQVRVDVEEHDLLIIINHRKGEITSLEGTIEGREIDFKEIEPEPRGSHYAFVKFEANGEGFTIAFADLDEEDDGAALEGRQKNRRVEMTIEFD